MKTHGHGSVAKGVSPEYQSWRAMITRCCNPKSDHYERYLGRGIAICPEWRASFETFLSDMGPRPPGTCLERIDNDGNYEPGNCRWATIKEQARNRWTTIWVVLDGERMILAEANARLGLPHAYLAHRKFRSGRSYQEVVDYYSRVGKRRPGAHRRGLDGFAAFLGDVP